jgi:formylglycine-generating enzyme required for sulfatase activity
MQKAIITLVFFQILVICQLLANNLTLGKANINGNTIELDISWDNAWNYWQQGGSKDAVWLFVKGKNSSGVWEHIDLSIESKNHYSMPPLSIEPVSDGKGVFVYAQASGSYDVTTTQISIMATTLISAFTHIRVFAIEMVHIPQGEYFLGDGASVSSLVDAIGNPILITSERAIDGNSLSILNANEQFPPETLPTFIPDEFPKGYKSFYVMKYELSQVQYVDFLNTLSFLQQQKRTAFTPSSPSGTFAMVNPYQPDSLYRNGIAISVSGSVSGTPAIYAMDGNANGIFNEDDDGLHRAANFLSWGDLTAYLDWAALRPITEMEFEKICRGVLQPVAGEFAWGTSTVTNANNPVNDGTVFEAVSEVPIEGSGLANHGNVVANGGWGLRGVLRAGFAANDTTNRFESGAAFYGVMEMSGNAWEYTIMVSSDGALFTGICGDGILDENGNANQPYWCNPDNAFGVLLKGGAWSSTISEVGSWRDLAISDRFYSHIKPQTRRSTTGGRGGR